ncbi:hypothetical protein Bca4012_033083 [Brassica carinata]
MAKQLQQSVTDTTRSPLVPAEKNNAVAATRRSRTMEVSSRYRSPTPTKTRRCPSPNVTRTVSSTSQSLSKRAVSAERKRSSTPTTPTNPSTPVSDVSIDLPVSSKKLSTGRVPEGLWPSTMRSLSVSFQSDSVSVPVVKEKPFVTSSIDRTLRPSSTSVSRKHTPERKRSPLKGKNVTAGQSENSKPVDDGPHSRLIEQHRWPSRMSMNRSLDLGNKAVRTTSLSLSNKSSKPLQKSSSHTARFSQWRFANARAEGVGYIQRLIAEETLYNVWHATSELRDHVTTQRIYLQQLKLEIKLEDILSKQMGCLEDWAILEREHVTSVAGAIADLEANTLRLPLTGGTKVDLGTLKLAMSSALDVMQTMGSSICSLHSQMEEMNKLVSDLAVIAAKEKYMLGKCENLLASTAVMEIEESSLMTHLMQKKQEEVRDDAESPLLPLGSFKCLWT